MKAVVQFRAGEVRYAVPVETVHEVRGSEGLVRLPAARASVVGIIERGSDTLTALTLPGAGGDQFVVLDSEVGSFGLIVDEVLGVLKVPDSQVGPRPDGQVSPVVDGVIHLDDGLVLLLDVAELRRWLETDERPSSIGPPPETAAPGAIPANDVKMKRVPPVRGSR